jgi:hypothetical protein
MLRDLLFGTFLLILIRVHVKVTRRLERRRL